MAIWLSTTHSLHPLTGRVVIYFFIHHTAFRLVTFTDAEEKKWKSLGHILLLEKKGNRNAFDGSARKRKILKGKESNLEDLIIVIPK